jgi:hypothetical protein
MDPDVLLRIVTDRLAALTSQAPVAVMAAAAAPSPIATTSASSAKPQRGLPMGGLKLKVPVREEAAPAATSDSPVVILSAIKNGLEAYKAAKSRKDWKENRRSPAVRSALQAIAVACSRDGAESALGGSSQRIMSEVNEERGAWANDKFRYNPETVKFEKPLDANGVTKDLFVVKALEQLKPEQRVFKPDTPGYKFDLDNKQLATLPTPPANMGIDEIGSRLSARSVASYKVDKLLETKVLARTRFAACTVKRDSDGMEHTLFGSLQNWTGGTSLQKREDKAELYKNPQIVKQLQHLQLIDYITGQGDRHADNIHIVGNDKVLGIDHDFSFPSQPMTSVIKADGVRNRGLPNYVDSELAEKVRGLGADEVLRKIGPYLSEAECTQTRQRFSDVKKALESNQIKVLASDGDWRDMAATLNPREPKSSELNSMNSYLYTGEVNFDKDMKKPNLAAA